MNHMRLNLILPKVEPKQLEIRDHSKDGKKGV